MFRKKVVFFSFVSLIWVGQALSSDFSTLDSNDLASFSEKIEKSPKRERDGVFPLTEGSPETKRPRLQIVEETPDAGASPIPDKSINYKKNRPGRSIASIRASKLQKNPSFERTVQVLDPRSQDEDCRKLVKSFGDDVHGNARQWHTATIKHIKLLKSELLKTQKNFQKPKKYCEAPLPLTTNFALARLVFVLQDRNPIEYPLKFIYLSSSPSRENKPIFARFGSFVRRKKLDTSLDIYQEYDLHCAQIAFDGSNTRERSTFAGFKEDLEEIVKNTQHKIKISSDCIPISHDRLQYHLNDMKENLAPNYFHSEQALRQDIGEQFDSIRSTVAEEAQTIENVILDICSYNDVCWRCADFLWMACYGSPEKKIVVRASGAKDYNRTADQFQLHLRHQNVLPVSPGYENPYRPYIAHTHKELLDDVS